MISFLSINAYVLGFETRYSLFFIVLKKFGIRLNQSRVFKPHSQLLKLLTLSIVSN